MFCSLLPRVFNCKDIKEETSSACKAAKSFYAIVAVVIDALTPVAFLVLGILAIYRIVPMPMMVTGAFVGAGIALSLSSILYLILMAKKEKPASGPVSTS